ncbi:Angiopoietin-like 1 [Mactra antiquata]
MKSNIIVAVLMIVIEFHAVCGNSFVCSLSSDNWFAMSESKTNERLQVLEEQVKQLQKLLQTDGSTKHTTIEGVPSDCEEILSSGIKSDGVYAISPDGRCPFCVYCDMQNGGWTIVQRRLDGSVNFYRPWDDYVTGFGTVEWEHWLGLEKIHRLTRDGAQIYFDLDHWDGSKQDAHYKVFTVHGASTDYRMNVNAHGFQGSFKELFSYHNNMKFSTYDRDNDASSSNCCKDHADGGGWWYNNCYKFGMLNSVYGKKYQGGIGFWDTKHQPLKNVTIKVKKLNGVC